jgi:ATP-dependent Lhr-like helicase
LSVFARLSPRLQEAIVARLGWTSLRPVQELAGEALLAGMNAVVLAPTAGGKTEAAIFPTLSLLLDQTRPRASARSTSPRSRRCSTTRPSASALHRDGRPAPLRLARRHHQPRAARLPPRAAELLMTTPESLEVMLVSERVDAAQAVRRPAHRHHRRDPRLAGTDRGAHLMSVLERLAAVSRHDVQRVGLSATVGNPAAILDVAAGQLDARGGDRRSTEAAGPAPAAGRASPELPALARDAAKVARGSKSLFFCQSRSVTEAVAEHMRRAGTRCSCITAPSRSRSARSPRSSFHHGTDACIVCTSTLELGIDVGDLDRVLQAEAPDTVSSFLQRMGRTGRRAGQVANTTFFCETSEASAGHRADRARQARLGRVGRAQRPLLASARPPAPGHALAHRTACRPRRPGRTSRVSRLRGIHRAEFERLIAWMLRDSRSCCSTAASSSVQRPSAASAAATSWSSTRSSRARRATPSRRPPNSRSAPSTRASSIAWSRA